MFRDTPENGRPKYSQILNTNPHFTTQKYVRVERLCMLTRIFETKIEQTDREQQKDGEDCIMMIFIICSVRRLL